MAINKALSKEIDALLERIACALEGNHLPELEDSVAFEQLYWEYREHTGDIQELGVRFRASSKREEGVPTITKDEVHCFVQCCVHRKQPNKSFAKNIRAYLRKELPIAKLLGRRDSKLRNDIPWQYYDRLGEIAEFAANVITVKATNKKLETSNRTLTSKRDFNVHLYHFLDDFSRGKIDDVIKKYNVTGEIEQLKSIMVSNVTAIQWRNAHKENRIIEAERMSNLQKRKNPQDL